MKIVLNGGFDFLHSGHIGFIKQAMEYGEVIIILNSDRAIIDKKGYVFMPEEERKIILENIKGVSKVIIAKKYNKNNALSVGKVLEVVRPDMVGIVEDTEKGENLFPVCERLGIKAVWLKRTNAVSSSKILRIFLDNARNISPEYI